MASMAVLLALLTSAVGTALAANPYCDNLYFWSPDGPPTPGGPDWSSFAATSAFVAGPCLGVSGIGTTETFQKTILVIDRSAAKNGYMTLPGRPNDLAYAQEVDLLTWQQRPLDVITNTFCSSGQHAPDGSFVSVGGDWSPDYAGPGEFSIRSFSPCRDGTCGFSIVDNLTHSRWYPTTALLGDGRILIVGGSSTGVGINSLAANVPFIEYYPKQPGEAYQAQFLTDTLPYNLYPFVHLLPSGRAFLFAGEQWGLWDTLSNDIVPGAYPPVGGVDSNGAALRQVYPLAGASALFPLSSENGYLAEIMICGGGGVTAIHSDDNGNTVEDAFYPASNQCFRIYPESTVPVWYAEAPMRTGRVMPVGVLLPEGSFLVIGGTQTGHSGLGKPAHNAALTPEMYDTKTHTWRAGDSLATSKNPRAYHSSAVVLHDGSVFVSGSNPNTEIVPAGPDEFPTEFRSEFFQPPYMAPGVVRPVVLADALPANVGYGQQLLVSFKFADVIGDVKVVLVQPGFSTHGGNHGMRNVELDADVMGMRINGQMHVLSATVPGNRNLLPPTWYWLFVVVNGVPNGEGVHVFVQ